MARPTKLDERTQNLILVGVRLGLTYADAAQAAGVSYRTFARWVHKEKHGYDSEAFTEQAIDALRPLIEAEETEPKK